MENKIDILVVEDSPIQAQKLEYILEKQGFHVSVTHNGKQAVSQLAEHKPDLVISDIVMPMMDGYELCRHIKKDKDLKDLPVILVTSLSDPLSAVEGLKSGADNFVTKPYNDEFLVSQIHTALKHRELRKDGVREDAIQIYFEGKTHTITSRPTQVLDLLFSIYSNAIQKNTELEQVNDYLGRAKFELKSLSEKLEQIVVDRTADLLAEIDERKRVEAELEKHRDHLEEKVRKRTSELQKMINLMSGRELRMVELKKAIKKLRSQVETAGLTPVADDPLREAGRIAREE